MTKVDHHDREPFLTPGEVAAIFRVTPKTVTRWAEAGKLPATRTLGGHRRFAARQVQQVLEELEAQPVRRVGDRS